MEALATSIDEKAPIRSAGACIINDEQLGGGAANFALMGTPDRVSNIHLEEDGLIFVSYRALWRETDAGAGPLYAAIFLDEMQIKTLGASGAAAPQKATYPSDINADRAAWLTTASYGLRSSVLPAAASSENVTTGLAIGVDDDSGICAIEAAEGVYDVSIRFDGGNTGCRASRRRLRVWSQKFSDLGLVAP